MATSFTNFFFLNEGPDCIILLSYWASPRTCQHRHLTYSTLSTQNTAYVINATCLQVFLYYFYISPVFSSDECKIRIVNMFYFCSRHSFGQWLTYFLINPKSLSEGTLQSCWNMDCGTRCDTWTSLTKDYCHQHSEGRFQNKNLNITKPVINLNVIFSMHFQVISSHKNC